jgi:hypothetical protein
MRGKRKRQSRGSERSCPLPREGQGGGGTKSALALVVEVGWGEDKACVKCTRETNEKWIVLGYEQRKKRRVSAPLDGNFDINIVSCAIERNVEGNLRRVLGTNSVSAAAETSSKAFRCLNTHPNIHPFLCCLLLEWRFTANQLILAPSPLRFTTNFFFFFFEPNPNCHFPYVTSSLAKGWVCLLWICLAFAKYTML